MTPESVTEITSMYRDLKTPGRPSRHREHGPGWPRGRTSQAAPLRLVPRWSLAFLPKGPRKSPGCRCPEACAPLPSPWSGPAGPPRPPRPPAALPGEELLARLSSGSSRERGYLGRGHSSGPASASGPRGQSGLDSRGIASPRSVPYFAAWAQPLRCKALVTRAHLRSRPVARDLAMCRAHTDPRTATWETSPAARERSSPGRPLTG